MGFWSFVPNIYLAVELRERNTGLLSNTFRLHAAFGFLGAGLNWKDKNQGDYEIVSVFPIFNGKYGTWRFPISLPFRRFLDLPMSVSAMPCFL